MDKFSILIRGFTCRFTHEQFMKMLLSHIRADVDALHQGFGYVLYCIRAARAAGHDHPDFALLKKSAKRIPDIELRLIEQNYLVQTVSYKREDVKLWLEHYGEIL